MATNDNIVIESNPIYKKGMISRTIYDVRQEIRAKVIGVLKYNNDIRKNLLNKNIGIYPQYKKEENIGYISNVYLSESNKPLSLDENGLLGYTHTLKSDYQTYINQKYDIGDYIRHYQHGTLPDINNLKWKGNYEDYTQYIDKVFGLEISSFKLLYDLFSDNKIDSALNSNFSNSTYLSIQSVLYDFLQYDNIKYAMEKTRIGTINPNVPMALTGAITTNINNFSGTDTRLGLITNQLYAHHLRNNAQFNSLRRTNYITLDAYSHIGNKLSTLSTIGVDYRIDDKIGRLVNDFYNFQIKYINPEKINLKTNDKRAYLENNIFKNTKEYFDNYFFQKNINKESDEKLQTLNPLLKTSYYNTNNLDLTPPTYFRRFNSIEPYDIFKKDKEYTLSNRSNSLFEITEQFKSSEEKKYKINTIFEAYGTNFFNNEVLNKKNLSKISRGRNLDCRIHTKSNPYSTISKTITHGLYKNNKDNISQRQNEYSCLRPNGFVNITPKVKNNNVDLKKCMFSIENLAWKDYAKNNLLKEQIGPNGGRIMWFPPYGLTFNENIGVNWNPNEFIGRGEKIYTYTNTERTGTLSFTLLIDHPNILNKWKKANNDDISDKSEDDVVRFFAGCKKLELNEAKKDENEKDTPIPDDKEKVQNKEQSEDIEVKIYFSNYYSGIDDELNEALNYLLNQYESTGDKPKEPLFIGNNIEWYYRIDKKYINSNLKNPANNNKDEGNFNLQNNFVTFYSLNTIDNPTVVGGAMYKLNAKKYATIKSHASNHGNNNINEDLLNNRSDFAKKLLIDKCGFKEENIVIKKGNIISVNGDNVSSEDAKKARCVEIKISNTKPEDMEDELWEEKDKIENLDEVIVTANNGVTEAEYFNEIGNGDNILEYQKIVEKVKYFTPAFHSITPEGFNNRLSFLHQCTRQGNTLGLSEQGGLKVKSAGNLAFGRPPICVLRIGDFYHTKIIISSITINYDKNGGVQWDLNPTGKGVQPIYADISLNFTFLGGSDIGAPIARLQNALSFNYYANQSLYTDASDKGYYDNYTPKISGIPYKPN